MTYDIECRKCGSDLEKWNVSSGSRINYCPSCGAKLLEKQAAELHEKTTDREISGMIQNRLLDLFQNRGGSGLSADELAYNAWEGENSDGAVFYSNYAADLFLLRHALWADWALGCLCDKFGDAQYYAEARLNCGDRFLVAVFICATEHYLYDQLGVDSGEGILSEGRARELGRLAGLVEYDGGFSYENTL